MSPTSPPRVETEEVPGVFATAPTYASRWGEPDLPGRRSRSIAIRRPRRGRRCHGELPTSQWSQYGPRKRGNGSPGQKTKCRAPTPLVAVGRGLRGARNGHKGLSQTPVRACVCMCMFSSSYTNHAAATGKDSLREAHTTNSMFFQLSSKTSASVQHHGKGSQRANTVRSKAKHNQLQLIRRRLRQAKPSMNMLWYS